MAKPVFKKYNQIQPYLIPPSWDEKIPPKHPVRIVNSIIDKIDLENLYQTYVGGGSSSYDPRMLLKALIFAYLNNIYASRKIEDAIKSNIYFIWLCGENEPDHNTINRFRAGKLDTILKDIFQKIVVMLAKEGLLTIKELFVDGTKIEANANKFTFVWGKTIQNNKKKMLEQVDELWKYAKQITKKELTDTEKIDFPTISPERLKQTIDEISEAIKDIDVPDIIKKKVKYAQKNYPEKLKEYNEKENILGSRNSYSKTDNDATFMRMKEDQMQNGQLKAAYNVQISTNNQIIVNYDLFSSPVDTTTFSAHLESYQKLYGTLPERVIADSGYGSEENYKFMKENDIEGFVKYNHFHQEQTGERQKKHQFVQEYLHYNSDGDYFVCPMGQLMVNTGTSTRETRNGFPQTTTFYTAENCEGCPMRNACNSASGNRTIQVNHKLNAYKQEAKDKLTSNEGQILAKRRSCDVEPVFGNIKHNKKFRRFNLRGGKKATTEFGLIAIAHNISKLIKSKQ